MKSLDNLREESSGNTRILWHASYWDGPISGVMLWNGEMCWFEQFGSEIVNEILMSDSEWIDYKKMCEMNNFTYCDDDRIEHSRDRHMKVYRLPENILNDIIFNHEIFKKYVGEHTDYDINGNRPIGKTISSIDYNKFLNNIKKIEFNLSDYEIIGEFLH